MRRRRRRILRDDVLAPWVTVAVVLGLWWLGASLLTPHVVSPWSTSAMESSTATDRVPSPSRRDVATAARRTTAGDDAMPLPADRAMPPPGDSEPAVAVGGGEIDDLRARRLLVPVSGIDASSLRSTFGDARGAGRRHEAMDILAPRGRPVLAALDGRVVKLFTSAAGGLTIYQYDDDEAFCYYYAHLDSYADLTEGQRITRGQTIGYVGTTGNAPPGTPHLHFAIFKLNADKRWWEGAPIDPFLVLH